MIMFCVVDFVFYEVQVLGIVCFYFDDGWFDIYIIVFLIFKVVGYVGLVVVEWQCFGNGIMYVFMMEVQWVEMYVVGWFVMGYYVDQFLMLIEVQQVVNY